MSENNYDAERVYQEALEIFRVEFPQGISLCLEDVLKAISSDLTILRRGEERYCERDTEKYEERVAYFQSIVDALTGENQS